MSDESEIIQHASTYEAMVAVMREIDLIAKSRKTEAQGNYNFRGIEELLEAFGPAARRHGLVPLPKHAGDPIISSYPTRGGGKMNWIILPMAVEFRATDNRYDVEVAQGFGEAADSGDKGVSKAFSVGYREIMFKTFAIPTRGAEYDTEQTAYDVTRASDADVAAQQASAAEKAEAWSRGLGWVDEAEHFEAWDQFRAWCKGDAESAVWARAYATAEGLRKSHYTAAIHHEVEEVLSHAKVDGDWKAGYVPPASEEDDDAPE